MTSDNKFIGLGVSRDPELYKQAQEQGRSFIFDVGVPFKSIEGVADYKRIQDVFKKINLIT